MDHSRTYGQRGVDKFLAGNFSCWKRSAVMLNPALLLFHCHDFRVRKVFLVALDNMLGAGPTWLLQPDNHLVFQAMDGWWVSQLNAFPVFSPGCWISAGEWFFQRVTQWRHNRDCPAICGCTVIVVPWIQLKHRCWHMVTQFQGLHEKMV